MMIPDFHSISQKIQFLEDTWLLKENVSVCYLNCLDFSEDDYRFCYSLMSDEKKKRIDRYRFKADKKRSVIGDALMRYSVSIRCGVSPKDICFKTNQQGKPFITNAQINVSVSHSGEYVVCACAMRNIGIDIEKISAYDDEIAVISCSENELRYIRKHTENDFYKDKASRFFQLWTMKEAYSKCVGTELFSGPQDIDLSDGMVLFGEYNGSKSHCIYNFDGYACSLFIDCIKQKSQASVVI